jgi:hypothetical protein
MRRFSRNKCSCNFFCQNILYRILHTSNEKCRRYVQNFCYALKRRSACITLTFSKLATTDRHQVVCIVSVKQYVQQATIQSRQSVNYKSERMYGTRSCSITFRKERLHEISLKSTNTVQSSNRPSGGPGFTICVPRSVCRQRMCISCVLRSVCSYSSCVPAAEDKPNGSLSVESGQGYLSSMSICSAAQ